LTVESSPEAAGAEVRTCTREDLEAVQKILSESGEAAQWSAAALYEAWVRNPELFLVACQSNQITGFICGRMAADEGEILNLAVKPELRRNGQGRKLTLQLLEAFRGADLARVFLEVRESNAIAIQFYGKLGFEPIGRREGYYEVSKEAALLLGMRL